jgi:hypothetical protein
MVWANAQESGFWSLLPAYVGSHRWPGGSSRCRRSGTFAVHGIHRDPRAFGTEHSSYVNDADTLSRNAPEVCVQGLRQWKRYLEHLLERMEREHARQHPGEAFKQPGSPRLAKLLKEAGYRTPKGHAPGGPLAAAEKRPAYRAGVGITPFSIRGARLSVEAAVIASRPVN